LRLCQGRDGNSGAHSLVAGVPARVLRPLSDQELAWKFAGTRTYQDLTRRSLATLVETEALTAVEPDRKRFDLPGVLPLIELRKLSENSG
jgi:phenylacetic acid degradation protein